MPDLLLITDDGTVTVVDMKPHALVEKPRVRAQFEWTRRLCPSKEWGYEVFTGGGPIVLRNIKLLAVGRRPGSCQMGTCRRRGQGLVKQGHTGQGSCPQACDLRREHVARGGLRTGVVR